MLKTGIGFNKYGFDSLSDGEALAIIKSVGFDSFFTGYKNSADDATVEARRNDAERLGLKFESLHAPFGGINCMWDEGERGDEYVSRLKNVADVCKRYDIGYFTLHCMNVPQFNVDVTAPLKCSQLGIDRFRRVVEYAAECGVKACFENVEFPQFELKSLLTTLRADGYPSLGFTWDVGHEHCYPAGLDIAEEFGDLLTGTHIHDNWGQTDSHVVTWNDDSHLLPFDGTYDFRRFGNDIKKCGYSGTLTLEVGKNGSIPWYRVDSLEEYLKMAHERAEHIAMLCE